MNLLENINQENDVRTLPRNELPELAREIRRFLIETVSKTGGHLAPNLGAVELTIALHRCMEFPKDKLIFDVGHQSYTHKILTGRRHDFRKLRQYGGMSGFPKSEESDADAFNTGHSSTSLSAALGYVAARELRGTDEKVCAVIGDGSLTGGMVYEALDQMAALHSNLVIVLNDNEMSIDRNVGSLSTVLSRFRAAPAYNRLKNDVSDRLMRSDMGEKVARTIKRSKDNLKSMVVKDNIFDEMGVTYLGPIDGHDIDAMIDIFRDAFCISHPVLVHVKTVKGKGYPLAERYPEHFHGVAPFDPATGRAKKLKCAESYTDVFSEKLLELGGKNKKIVAITAAMARGTGVRAFQRVFPERTFDVGIAEQHAVTFAAGLAKGGYLPVVAIYSSFLQRAYDQMLHDVCLQKLHVIFCIDRSGLVGEDGETHHGIYDTAYLRSLPGMTVIAPRGKRELEAALDFAVKYDGPVAIKYGKGAASLREPSEKVPFVPGRSEVVSFSRQVGTPGMKRLGILAVGSMVDTALEVRDLFTEREGMTPEVVNVRFVKPLDQSKVLDLGQKMDVIAVLEESVRPGSVGEEVSWILAQNAGCRAVVVPVCIPAETVPHGSIEKLRQVCGLDPESIYRRLRKCCALQS